MSHRHTGFILFYTICQDHSSKPLNFVLFFSPIQKIYDQNKTKNDFGDTGSGSQIFFVIYFYFDKMTCHPCLLSTNNHYRPHIINYYYMTYTTPILNNNNNNIDENSPYIHLLCNNEKKERNRLCHYYYHCVYKKKKNIDCIIYVRFVLWAFETKKKMK